MRESVSFNNIILLVTVKLEAMPIVDSSKDLNDVDLHHDVLPVLNLLNKDGMFQNRQSTRTRNERLKQTSSLFRLQKAALRDEI